MPRGDTERWNAWRSAAARRAKGLPGPPGLYLANRPAKSRPSAGGAEAAGAGEVAAEAAGQADEVRGMEGYRPGAGRQRRRRTARRGPAGQATYCRRRGAAVG